MPTISLILPVYKIAAEYLARCLESIKAQTFQDFEVLLVDDNDNQDPSGKLCDHYADVDARVTALHQENQGVSAARNNGMVHAAGKWIAFVDPDDWLEPEYLERLLRNGEKSDADIVMCSCYADYSNKEIRNEFFKYPEKIFESAQKDELLFQFICRGMNDYFPPETGSGVPWAKLYRKAFLDCNHLLFDVSLIRMQDNVFNLYAVECANHVFYFNECLYHYRKNNWSATKTYNSKIIQYFERVNEATLDFIKKYNKGSLFYKALNAKVLIGFNSYINLYYFPFLKSSPGKYRLIIKEINSLLNQKNYHEAFEAVDTGLLNFQERVYVTLLKRRMISLLFLLTFLRETFRSLRNGIPEK